MANITNLARIAPAADNIIHHSDGNDDYACTVAEVNQANTDAGVIYDPAGPMTVSLAWQPIVGATEGSLYARGFTVNAANGTFTLNSTGAGKVYELNFTFVIERDNNDTAYWARVNINGTTRILANQFVGNDADDAYIALSGSYIVSGAAGNPISVEVAASSTQAPFTPETVMVKLEAI